MATTAKISLSPKIGVFAMIQLLVTAAFGNLGVIDLVLARIW